MIPPTFYVPPAPIITPSHTSVPSQPATTGDAGDVIVGGLEFLLIVVLVVGLVLAIALRPLK